VSRGGLLTFFVLLGLSAAVAWWFFENFEEREEEVFVGYRGEARTNPLLAARRYLKAMGIAAYRVDGLPMLDQLPSRGQTLIVATGRGALAEGRVKQLLEWTRAGGHLVTAALSSDDVARIGALTEAIARGEFLAGDRASPLLAPLGLELRYHGAVDDEPRFIAETPPIEGFLETELLQAWTVEGTVDGDWLLEGQYGALVVHRPLGAGAITVVNELTWLENDRIGARDHAELLWWLLHLDGRASQGVWLLHDDEMPPLWRWLWTHAMPVVVSVLLLALAALAAAAPRFGPLQGKPAPVRRRLIEHIEASGEFLWRHGQGAHLVAATRRALERRLLALHPNWGALPADKREHRLAEIAGLTPEGAHRLLHAPVPRERGAVTDTIRQLEIIRKGL
jgi:hypothetical protein